MLFGFSVKRVLPAKSAIFIELQAIGIVFLVLGRIVISLLAFRTS
jgi:hypothetical protein